MKIYKLLFLMFFITDCLSSFCAEIKSAAEDQAEQKSTDFDIKRNLDFNDVETTTRRIIGALICDYNEAQRSGLKKELTELLNNFYSKKADAIKQLFDFSISSVSLNNSLHPILDNIPGFIIFRFLISIGAYDQAKAIVDRHPEIIDLIDENGDNAIQFAEKQNFPEITKYLKNKKSIWNNIGSCIVS